MLKAIDQVHLCPMPTPRRRRDRKPDRRRALQLLGAAADGYTEGVLRAHGVTIELIAGFVHAGLATKSPNAWSSARRQLKWQGCGSRRQDGGCSQRAHHDRSKDGRDGRDSSWYAKTTKTARGGDKACGPNDMAEQL